MSDETKSMCLIVPPSPGVLRVDIGAGPLIEVYPDGRVVAPSVEAAGEAGRVFVREVRGAIEAVRREEREKLARHLEELDAATSSWEHFGQRALNYAAHLKGLL